MISILEEIEKRSAYYLPVTEIDTVYENFQGKEAIAVLIMPERYFKNAALTKPEILNDYNITGIFDLGEIYSPYVDLRFSMYVIEKKQTNIIKTAVFKESLYRNEKPSGMKYNPGTAYLAVPDNLYPSLFFNLNGH